MGTNSLLSFFTGMMLVIVLTVLGVKFYPLAQSVSDGGFNSVVEKTAPTTEMEVEPKEHIMKINDIYLAILLLDDFHPVPDVIEIRRYNHSNVLTASETYDITVDFLNDRDLRIRSIRNKFSPTLPDTHTVTYDLKVNANGSIAWLYRIDD